MHGNFSGKGGGGWRGCEWRSETSKPTAVCSNIGTNRALQRRLNYYANGSARGGVQRSDVTLRNKYINALSHGFTQF